ncbi:flagellar motor stator protein MotA [Terribacillus aidingensis]|uniref:flagellar motor stator protein MotA n=1 Tax=Terribacillus aidingensis TaxID=586416 RepID=UPI003450865C
MDKSSIIGVILGLVAVGVGMVLKGVSPAALINPAAILIIIVGTAASVVLAFPGNELKRFPKLLGVVFKNKQEFNTKELVRMFSEWSQISRKEGLLALENSARDVEDDFLRNGLSMAVDGESPEYIRNVLNEEVDALEDRHAIGASIFTQAGTYAPSLGVLGAVIGLIAALGDISDIDKLSHAIAAAFVATLMGIFTGYVICHPIANKLKRKTQQEVQHKLLMVEGILSILEGETPRMLEQKLLAYLPSKEKAEFADAETEEEVAV